MADLSLKIAVKLLTKEFKNGVAGLVASLRGLQAQFLAFTSTLGAGTIGLSNFLSRMREVSKETTAARIALKNVSSSAQEFADSQKWLLDVSKRYGVGINTLTSGFAKFKSAADNAGMSLSDQKQIFEAVSRASVAYALSAEDQRGIFITLQQMMSKGKVMAEELRLQMAERMPVALQAMAAASKTTVAGLDALMKKGKVLSSEVLPEFARQLNRMIPNVDTDNLNKSLIDLSNTFVALTDKLGVEKAYKKVVEMATSALSWLMENTKAIGVAIRTFVSALIAGAIRKTFRALVAESEKATAAAIGAIKNKETAAKAVAAAEERVLKAKTKYEEALHAEAVAAFEASQAKKLRAAQRTASALRQLEKQQTALAAAEERARAAEAAVTESVQRDAARATGSAWSRAWHGATLAFKAFGQTLKSLAYSTIWTAIIQAILEVVNALKDAYSKFAEIHNLAQKTQERLNAPTEATEQEISIGANYKVASDENQALATRNAALQKINALLGTEYQLNGKNDSILGEINKKKDRYIQYLRLQKQLENATDVRKTLSSQYTSWQKGNQEWGSGLAKAIFVPSLEPGKKMVDAVYNSLPSAGKNLQEGINVAQAEIVALTTKLAEFAGEFDSSSLPQTPTPPTESDDTDDGKRKQSELERAQERYRKSLAELSAEYEAGMLSEREFQRRKKDLIEKTYIDAKGTSDQELLGSDFYKGIEAEFGGFTHGNLREREEVLETRIDEFNQALSKQKVLLDNGAISQDEYNDALRSLSIEFYKELSSLDLSGLSAKALDAMVSARTEAALINADTQSQYEPRRRDRTVDFLRNDTSQLEEQKKDAEHYLAWLKEQQLSSVADLSDEINKQMAQVESLEEALQLERVREAIKDYGRELRRTAYEGVKGTISNIDGVVNAFERVSEVMKSPDASGWERIMAVWNAMTSVVDTFIEIIDLITKMTEITEMLTKAKQIESAVDTSTTEAKIGNLASATAADSAATSAQLANSKSLVTAKTAEAGANAAADTSKIPFGWMAIPAVIAAVIAMFAALPKFAKGGVVGGNSKAGDKILARLNSGEGVLTEQGMENLAGAARPRTTDVHITGELTASGRDLRLVLDRTDRHNNRIR
ncbi:MAG: tape measure protein [Alistipes sp.]|nr:tape measure protein [Alistipes sp.]